jgi:hypothetical protein
MTRKEFNLARAATPGDNPAPQMAKAKRGRPALKITAKHRAACLAHAMYGVPHAQIALLLGISEDSLRKYLGHELALGKARATTAVLGALYRTASGKGRQALAAQIFWAKAQAGWRETSVVQNQNLDKDGKPVDPPGTVIRFDDGGPGQ